MPGVLVGGVLVLLALLAAGALYQSIGGARDARRYPAPGLMIDIGGRRLHATCLGGGAPAVIFEAAIAASSLSWARVLPEVAAFTRACAYDRAGLGWSERPRTPRTLARVIADFQSLRAKLSLSSPSIFVGHSFGALVVCAYAAAHPMEVAGLVLIDPPTEWRAMTTAQARTLWGGIQLSRLGAVLARAGVVRACLAFLTGGAPGVPRNFVRIFGPTAAATLGRLVEEVQKLPAAVHPIVQAHWCDAKCFRAMADYLGVLEETLASTAAVQALPNVPLVVISSGRQPPDRLAEHRALSQLSPQGRHVIAAGSGHWIPFDQPDLVISAIRDLVDRARPRS